MQALIDARPGTVEAHEVFFSHPGFRNATPVGLNLPLEMSDAISQSLKAILSRRCTNFFSALDADDTGDGSESSTDDFFGHRSDPYLESEESRITITVTPNKFAIPREETAYGTSAPTAVSIFSILQRLSRFYRS